MRSEVRNKYVVCVCWGIVDPHFTRHMVMHLPGNMFSFPLCIFVSCNIYISKMNAVIPFETSCVCCRIWGLWVSGWEHFPSVFLLGWILLFPLSGWKCLPFVSVFFYWWKHLPLYFLDENIYPAFLFPDGSIYPSLWMKPFIIGFILVKNLPFIVFVSGWKRFKSLVSLCGWKHLTFVFVFG